MGIPYKSALGNAGGREDAIKANLCISRPLGCGKPVRLFADRDSYREYLITGMCQTCQNEFYESCMQQEHGYCDAYNPCVSPDHGSCPYDQAREDHRIWAAGATGQQEVYGPQLGRQVDHAGEQQQSGAVAQ
jgi:hypothetical protein